MSAYGSRVAAARSSATSNPRRLRTPVSGSISAIVRWWISARTRRPFRNWIATIAPVTPTANIASRAG
jgi:hypothetical protein